ncbi:TolB-like translocation protein [Yinghuangia soli]|uniref:TolB-like translocation protein n=1 Tax=Yinghuangia soli TaxID=2908204 RepID=A0AA41PUU4_9ACTN|nr:TolB-like translocation protein [Yinghuangia soli]MCF2525621.1 TolB-like translocation protein [Yinghuangia soli]
MTRTARTTVLAVVTALLIGIAVAYTWHAAGRSEAGPDQELTEVTLDEPGRILFRTTQAGTGRDHMAALDLADTGADDGKDPRRISPTSCLVFHAAKGTAVCLKLANAALHTYNAVILDRRLMPVDSREMAGTPSRTRVSPSGNLAAWTSFVGGESYAGLDFSTRTAILDRRSGTLHDNLEDFAVIRDGKPYKAADINIWGVTFAADDNRFYATVATDGHRYLAEGDLAARTLRTIRDNVECPSLSPDGTKLAYKKRVEGADPDRPWKLFTLDLATGTETLTTETRPLDDQAEWLDDRTLLYNLPGDLRADVWSVPADGTGKPTLVVRHALSPTVLRP